MDRAICDSGRSGWQCRLRENYSHYREFRAYSEMYGLHGRLGYETPADAWRDNPLVQGSVVPEDFRKVDPAGVVNRRQ